MQRQIQYDRNRELSLRRANSVLHTHERFTQKGGERTTDKQRDLCARISRIRSRDGQNFNDRGLRIKSLG